MRYCLCIMADLSSWLTEKSAGIKTFKQKIVLRTKETTKGLRGLKDHRNTSCFALPCLYATSLYSRKKFSDRQTNFLTVKSF